MSSAVLRVVLDQLIEASDADLSIASRQVAAALVRTAPPRCTVEAIVPRGGDDFSRAVPGLMGIERVSLPPAAMRSAWQVGVSLRPSGLVHSPTLVAPLARHDRVNDNDQVVVTMWDASPWIPGADDASADDGASLARRLGGSALTFARRAPTVAWARTVMKRLERFADAVVVPTHAAAEWLEAHTRLSGRVRVIGGAAPDGFAPSTDAVGRRRAFGLTDEGYVLVTGAVTAEQLRAFTDTVDVPVVVWGELLDGEVEHHGVQHPGTERDGVEPDVVEASRRVVLPLDLDDADRAAVLAGSCALVATSTGANYPWRVIEALTMGVPVVAAASDTHRETVLEAGLVVDVDRLPDALAQVLRDEETRDRFAIRAADRGRGFSWWDHGTRVWALHAEL